MLYEAAALTGLSYAAKLGLFLELCRFLLSHPTALDTRSIGQSSRPLSRLAEEHSDTRIKEQPPHPTNILPYRPAPTSPPSPTPNSPSSRTPRAAGPRRSAARCTASAPGKTATAPWTSTWRRRTTYTLAASPPGRRRGHGQGRGQRFPEGQTGAG